MHRNKSVSQHNFAMVPRADIPRSSFRMTKTLKTTFNASSLIPIFLEEVLPGDKFKLNMTAFARLATPIVPFMDNLHFECFWFFCPNRLVWDNWHKFMGEQDTPASSIAFTIPQLVSPVAGFGTFSLGDYFGLPTVGQITLGTFSVSALPFRMYNLIWNEWFRDENLQGSLVVQTDDGPDSLTNAALQVRGKRHDYFTSCLPFPQKGTAVSIPINVGPTGTTAFGGPAVVVKTHSASVLAGAQNALFVKTAAAGATPTADRGVSTTAGGVLNTTATVSVGTGGIYPSNLIADLSDAAAGTINTLRTAFQIQKLLERDARGGTRYTEIIRSHFGVVSPDARLQRPEYLGGGSVPVAVNPIAQTSATTASGTDTPQGNLAAIGTSLLRAGFTQAFTEHGYIMGMVNARADLTYQQGLRRHWSRLTRYEFYFPVFAMLGEQAVLTKEIYTTGGTQNDVFGYQERWAEYRYTPSEITGSFRSTYANPLDIWHFSERFTTPPQLNAGFILDPTINTLQRALALGALELGQQLIADIFFDVVAVRPMPMYSVPGLVDHF